MDWWIADDGYADLDRVGKLRYFARNQDEIIWADEKEEIIEEFPDSDPKSVTFIPFTIFDNPILLEKDPGYLANLKSLGYVDQERLLGDKERGGNWHLKEGAGTVFNQEWFKIIEPSMLPRGGVECRFFDTAGTIKKYSSDDPDFTAGVSMRWYEGKVYITDVIERRIHPAEFYDFVKQTFLSDQVNCQRQNVRYMARWEQEPGSASIRESYQLATSLHGVDARGISKRGDKLSEWKPLASLAYYGDVYLVKGSWNRNFLNHMHGQPDMPHDDIADASAGAYNELVKESKVRKAQSKDG